MMARSASGISTSGDCQRHAFDRCHSSRVPDRIPSSTKSDQPPSSSPSRQAQVPCATFRPSSSSARSRWASSEMMTASGYRFLTARPIASAIVCSPPTTIGTAAPPLPRAGEGARGEGLSSTSAVWRSISASAASIPCPPGRGRPGPSARRRTGRRPGPGCSSRCCGRPAARPAAPCPSRAAPSPSGPAAPRTGRTARPARRRYPRIGPRAAARSSGIAGSFGSGRAPGTPGSANAARWTSGV